MPAIDVSKKKHTEMRRDLVYCVHERSDGYILLNREYKPIGCGNEYSDYVDYDSPEFAHSWVTTAQVASHTQWPIPVRCDSVRYLYDDGSMPWRGKKNRREYHENLAAMMESFRKSA